MKGLSWYQTGKSSNFWSGARHVGADGMWGATTSFSSGFVAARVKSRAGRRRVRIDVMLESEELAVPLRRGDSTSKRSRLVPNGNYFEAS